MTVTPKKSRPSAQPTTSEIPSDTFIVRRPRPSKSPVKATSPTPSPVPGSSSAKRRKTEFLPVVELPSASRRRVASSSSARSPSGNGNVHDDTYTNGTINGHVHGLSVSAEAGPSRPKPAKLVLMRNFDEAFEEPARAAETLSSSEDEGEADGADVDADANVSRSTFLANERLKRQREARNFVYNGDENAPKLTRSGRVVGRAGATEEEGVGYGEPVPGDPSTADGAAPASGLTHTPIPLREPASMLVDLASPAATPTKRKAVKERRPVRPLPEGARGDISRILAELTGRGDAHPPPFIAEDANEALHGLVNLLKGTVERGEGNSALVVGPRGSGKTRTMNRALDLLPSTLKTAPIIVRLSGYAQTSDRLAIREMGRQIVEAEGGVLGAEADEDDEDEGYAPTTLPSHLLALLTKPSPRAIVIVMEEFDLFTEHARQALLYCILDVVQSIKTGPVAETGRGVAVVGLTSRTDTLLLLEKRVKSRFSHRVWRVTSPLSPGSLGWLALLLAALVPWKHAPAVGEVAPVSKELKTWRGEWSFAIDMLLKQDKVVRYLDRIAGLSTDVRILYRPFTPLVAQVAGGTLDFISVPLVTESILAQVDGAGWGLATAKLRGLSQPALAVLVVAKHLHYAGRDEFNFAQVEEEYVRFARTRLVGSGRGRWPLGILRGAYDSLLGMALLVPTGNASARPRFARVRCALSAHEIVAWFKGDGAASLGPELGNWARTVGGHA